MAALTERHVTHNLQPAPGHNRAKKSQWFNEMMYSLDTICGILGEPAHAGDSHAIYHADCAELMASFPDACIPLTVTSPPYNIGKEYEAPMSLEEYLRWSEHWIGQVHRITTGCGAFWLNLGYVSIPGRAKAIPLPYLLWDRIPFYLEQEVVWHYKAGVAARKSFSPRNEKFLWYLKDPEQYTFHLDAVRDPDVKYPNQKKNGKLKCNQLGKNPGDVWQFAKVTSGKDRSSKERTPHPAQFPLAVVSRIVEACSNPGELVFDPFLGSGTVIEAAIRLGRCAVGFEINRRYVDLAERRVSRVLREIGQPTLF